jgi:hypothetical protein
MTRHTEMMGITPQWQIDAAVAHQRSDTTVNSSQRIRYVCSHRGLVIVALRPVGLARTFDGQL